METAYILLCLDCSTCSNSLKVKWFFPFYSSKFIYDLANKRIMKSEVSVGATLALKNSWKAEELITLVNALRNRDEEITKIILSSCISWGRATARFLLSQNL